MTVGYSEQGEGCTAAYMTELEAAPGPAAGDGRLGSRETLTGAASRSRTGIAAGRQKGVLPGGSKTEGSRISDEGWRALISRNERTLQPIKKNGRERNG